MHKNINLRIFLSSVRKSKIENQKSKMSMEKNLNFDEIIDRRNTLSLKYDFAERRGKPADVLPLWVADMDFKVSSYIQDALQEAVSHGIFGYSDTLTPYYVTISNHFRKKHGYHFDEDDLVKTPGIVFALAMAVKAFTRVGESVIILQPVYYPFSDVILDNGRNLVSSTLVLGDDSRYHIDFEDFEKKIVENKVRLFFLCNPHNPVARVWTKDELLRLGDICLRNNVIVVSDEIHKDFTFVGEHTVFAGLSPELDSITITCSSPSKTFNLAGGQVSNIIIRNPELRKRFRHEIDAAGYSQLNVFGLVATQTAYEKGHVWYNAMIDYVRRNIEFARQYIERNLPKVRMIKHEATYLLWLDFRAYGLSPTDLDDLIINKAKLWLDSGRIFGKSGEGFQRINVACPRSVLVEALGRLKKALEG